jgi:hemolysin III
MLLFDLREPINALSHGAGMVLALPVTWLLWRRSNQLAARACETPASGRSKFQRGKALCLLVFGLTLIGCYGVSAAFHGVWFDGEPLRRLQRLDHVGIYLLIAGTYTPVAWTLMRGSWSWGTLTTVWTVAILCASRVWYGGVLPIWVSTAVYLAMGWGALFCYFKLAQTHSHWTLLPLPLGGVFYSIGAVVNLLRWPVLLPGVFAAHELLHLFVIAGSSCHIFFMMKVVVPFPTPSALTAAVNLPRNVREPRWEIALRRGSRWFPHLPAHQRRVKAVLAADARIRAGADLESRPPDNAVGAA